MMGIQEEQIALTDKVKRYERALHLFASMAGFFFKNPLSEMFMSVFYIEVLNDEDRKFMASIAHEFAEKERNNEQS